MRSPELGLVLGVLLLCLGAGPAQARQELAAGPDDREVAAAVERVRADPNLAGTRTVRDLRWRDGQRKPASGGTWLRDLFATLAESTRVVVWVAIAVLAVLIAAYLVRVLPGQLSAGAGADPDSTPTHVRDLDIRPESLPDDVGAAARALWDAGRRRAALALLYRGLLSRLAHTYRVPIRDSSTEGDCLSLASSRIEPPAFDYARRLVNAWQRSVYGGFEVDTVAVHELCDRFRPALDAPQPPAAGPGDAS